MPRGSGRATVWLEVASVCIGIASGAARGDLVVSNAALELRLDDTTGAVRQLRHLQRGLELITQSDGHAPWGLNTSLGLATSTGFFFARDDLFAGEAYDLRWTTDIAGVSVEARVELPLGARPARFWGRVINQNPAAIIESLEYPRFDGIQRLVPGGGSDVALSAAAQGYLEKDPWVRLGSGIVKRLYPDGYAGVSLQTSAYFRDGVGGFAFEVRDRFGTAKNFVFAKDPASGDVRWSVEALAWDRQPGRGLDPGYASWIVPLQRGDWEEAGDHYREWALEQPWVQRGPLRARPAAQTPRWLYEEVLASSFGISINLDQSRWFRALHDWVGGPVFHISGFWWPGGTSASEWYGGYNDWSDGRVNPANLAAIAERGDRFGLFLFDLHFSRDATEWDHPAPTPASDPIAPWQPYEMQPDPETPPWGYICPATSVWPAFHGWRDRQLRTLYGYDANYYDIGVGLGRVRCDQTAHGHPSGSGRWMIDAYRRMLADQRSELQSEAGRPIAAGTELISELVIDDFDYYQARAEAGVMSMLEGDPFRAGERAGWRQKVPLFAYVYHDVGPVRLDGNLKAATAYGTIFYWIAARTVAWGGLPELNYELSALEKFPGMNDSFTWYETYKSTFHVIDRTPYLAAPDRGQFLQRLGRARTGFGRPWLAYGRMTRSPRLLSGPAPISVDWHLYNTFNRATDTSSGIETGPEFWEQGSLSINPLVVTGWDDAGRSAGLFLVNVSASDASATIETDPARSGLPFLNYARTRLDANGAQDLGVVTGVQPLTLVLPARTPLMVRLQPAECSASTCQYRIYRESSAAAAVLQAAPFATATGHRWQDPTSADGATRFYVVDDGGHYPTTIQVTKPGGVVQIDW